MELVGDRSVVLFWALWRKRCAFGGICLDQLRGICLKKFGFSLIFCRILGLSRRRVFRWFSWPEGMENEWGYMFLSFLVFFFFILLSLIYFDVGVEGVFWVISVSEKFVFLICGYFKMYVLNWKLQFLLIIWVAKFVRIAIGC